ncbi:MAG: DoxX family protein [Cyclobacteriaceae bacterium]|nr:DoxX family protein [Cyclobacteriaceae bacterium]
MRLIDAFSRYFVGGLFIFSGLIKLNDPIGTKIKLEEYFEVFSVDFASFFEWFIPMALPLAMILIILELALGVAVLLNYKMNITTWVLLVLILFFTFLTFYSAYFDKVTDCGCFGDAIPLDPWQSFFKDVILIVFIAHLFWYRKKYHSFLSERVGHYLVGATVLISFIVGMYALAHLPYIDFRPYKVGNNIPEQMIPEEQPVIEYVFEKDGKEVSSPDYLTEEDGYKYISSRIINEKATIAKISDYQVISPDGEDITEQTFEGIKLVIVMHDVKELSFDDLPALARFIEALEGKIELMVFTAIGEAEFENIRHEYQLAVPYYSLDWTVLKAMIRSNPGILLLKDGTVLGKWHINDLPDPGEIAELL